jgi:hypothetical protein
MTSVWPLMTTFIAAFADPLLDPPPQAGEGWGAGEFHLIAGIVLDNDPSMPYVVLTLFRGGGVSSRVRLQRGTGRRSKGGLTTVTREAGTVRPTELKGALPPNG